MGRSGSKIRPALKKYRLLVSDEAYWDMVEAIDYYKSLSPGTLEDRFREQLKEGMDYITRYPQHFAIKYKGIRIYNLKRFPYQIHYLLEGEVVMVFGVFHGSSDPNSWENRLKR